MHVHRLLPDLGFSAAAADCPAKAAIRPHDHLGARLAGGGATCGGNRGDDQWAVFFQGQVDFVEDFFLHGEFSIAGELAAVKPASLQRY